MFRPLMIFLAAHAVIVLAVAMPATAFAAGGPKSFRGDYTVSFLGLPVGRATFASSYKGGTYAIDGSVSSAGLARIFDDTHGTLRATGRLSGSRLEPLAFRADYTSGKKASMVDIRFAGDKVISTKVAPPPKKRGKNWIALAAADLKGAMDPMAATVIQADSLDDVCGRTVKMYDGEMRADLKLAYVSRGEVSVQGYQGPTVTCRMGFEPVSGYRKGRKALEFLKRKSRIQVTFAPLGQTGIYAPIRATIGTEIGTLTVQARRFEAVD